ncbi:MAG: signal peptidase I [Myxococcota bacterium]|nr:signal peptidase I [Myxococcota bacterium]
MAGLAALLIVRAFFIGLVSVGTSSMAPTVRAGEVWAYLKGDSPEVGDVVVVRLPDEPEVLHVKRVVASEGQEVELSEGRLYVNGQRIGKDELERTRWRDTDCVVQESHTLRETLNARDWEIFSGGTHGRTVVGAGGFWLLGDNRGASSDSRHWGAINGDWIVGTLRWRLASPDRCGDGDGDEIDP